MFALFSSSVVDASAKRANIAVAAVKMRDFMMTWEDPWRVIDK